MKRMSSMKSTAVQVDRQINDSAYDNVKIVADDIAHVNTVADAIGDGTFDNVDIVIEQPLKGNINALGPISSNITTVAGISANVTTVATNAASVTNVASNIANIISVNSNIAYITTVANNISNINNVATQVVPNITEILQADDNAATATTKASEASTSATNSATSATNAQLSYWRAQAERMTADSYATEPEDSVVKIYTSDGDGTFTATATSPAEYSSLHWRNKAQNIASGSIDGLTDVNTAGKVADSLLAWNGTDSYITRSITDLGAALDSDLDSHTGNTNNPHSVTASQVGLGSVDNTSDADKPISSATQTALDSKAGDNAVVKLIGDQSIAGKKEFTGVAQFSKGSDIASSNSLTIGTDGNYFDVTGTTSITSINTSGHIGTVIKLHFDSSLVIAHNSTNLILPGSVDITTAAGDECELIEYSSGSWRCTSYSKADGSAITGFDVEKSVVIGREQTVSSWSYNGTTITVNTSSSHGLSVNDSIRVEGMTSATNAPNGLYVVGSVVDSDTITFTARSTPTGTAGGTVILFSGDITANGSFIGKNACTAWVNFDGTTTPPTIKDSYNIRDVVRTNTGRYTVYFENPMDNTNYCTVEGSIPTISSGIVAGSAALESFNYATIFSNTSYGNYTRNSITVYGGKD